MSKKALSIIPLIFCNLFFVKYPDTLKSIPLKEVRVLERKIKKTEKPSKKNFKGFRIVRPIQLAILVDEPFLRNEYIKSFSICFATKASYNDILLIEYFSVGENALPEKKLNVGEIVVRGYNSGWNSYNISNLKIKIPPNGLFVIFHLLEKQSGVVKENEAIFGLGKYKKSLIYYTRNNIHDAWINVFKGWQSKNIAPMIQLEII